MCLIKWQTDKVPRIKGHDISTSYFAESYWIIRGDKIFIVLHLNNAKVILHSDFRMSKGCNKLCNYLTLSRLHFIFSNDFVETIPFKIKLLGKIFPDRKKFHN